MDEPVVKEEEITEEDPLWNTIQITKLDEDPLEDAVAPMKKERMEDDEHITIKEEPIEAALYPDDNLVDYSLIG